MEFRRVSKRYPGGSTAVDDLSFVVEAGELCVLVGPSGCGKTTTLRMVNRLVEPSGGQVLIDGRDVMAENPTTLRRRIGYVIQQTGLFPHQTIATNVATVPRLLGWPAARSRERVDELLTLVGLEPTRVRDRYPAELSGGERQRVGVARALAAEPPVMLMDEPFGAVDPLVRARLQDELRRLHRTLGTTILFVTHDIDEAIGIGNRVAVFQVGGHLAQYARPGELLARPANDFVARFVGADRALKHLALLAVRDAPLDQALTARAGEPTASARARLAEHRATALLVLAADERPLGWLLASALAAADAMLPEKPPLPAIVVDDATSLRDALALLLDEPLEQAIVVDDGGRYRATLGIEGVAAALRAATAAARGTPPAAEAAR